MTPPAHFRRPGITHEFLQAAGCRHVGADECVKLYGCRAEGIAIPFSDLDGKPILEKEKQFARIRLYEQTNSQKYHQQSGSGLHVFIPHNFKDHPRGSTLIVGEGEFKSMSLSESGCAAIGLCGICGGMRTEHYTLSLSKSWSFTNLPASCSLAIAMWF